jgi:signal transduction histidine kinase
VLDCDGQKLTVLLSANVISAPVNTRASGGVVVTMTDISERKRAEEALRRAHDKLAHEVAQRTAELTELSHHLLRVAEEERAHLASELHDEVGGILVALSLRLQRLSRDIPASLSASLVDASQLIQELKESQRRIVNSLRPLLLDTQGLAPAIEQHVSVWGDRTGVRVQVELSAGELPLGCDESLALFRVCQEALNNVAKHALANQVLVRLVDDANGVRLLVEDDGIGLPLTPGLVGRAHGLLGIRERLRAVGGSVVIRSGSPGAGTTVDAWLPRQP